MPKVDLRTPLGVEIGENYIRGCDLIALIISFISLFTAMCMKIRGVQSADFIGLTFILIVVMFWQGFRNNPELRILPFRVEEEEGSHTEPSPAFPIRVGYYKLKWLKFRKLKLLKITVDNNTPLRAYFDIGNVGVHDLVVQEFRVYLKYPREKEFIYPLIEGNTRKPLRCGERYTDYFYLPPDGELGNGLHVFQVVVYTAAGGKKRLLIVYRRNNTIYYYDPLREWGIDFKKLEKKLDESSNFL